MQLSITLAEILNYFLGSTTLVSIYLAWKSRKSSIKQAEATAPALQLEGSDDNGLTWTALSTPQVAVANSTISLRVADVNVQLVRARVSTAGVGVTAGHVLIKGY